MARAIPNVPLVVCDIDGSRIWLSCLCLSDKSGSYFDIVVDCLRPGEKTFEVVVAVVDVGVDGDVVNLISKYLQHSAIPRNPICSVVTRTRGDEFDVAINQTHGLRGFERKLRVLFRAFVAQLPRTIDLITEGPVLDLVRLFTAVLSSLIGPVRVTRLVAVLNPVTRVVDCPETSVDTDVWFSSQHFAVTKEFVGANAITFHVISRYVEPRRYLLLR